MTPYLILDNEMMTALKFAAKRGVEVIIIMPHVQIMVCFRSGENVLQ